MLQVKHRKRLYVFFHILWILCFVSPLTGMNTLVIMMNKEYSDHKEQIIFIVISGTKVEMRCLMSIGVLFESCRYGHTVWLNVCSRSAEIKHWQKMQKFSWKNVQSKFISSKLCLLTINSKKITMRHKQHSTWIHTNQKLNQQCKL